MNHYEKKRADKKGYYATKAKKLRQESNEVYEQASSMAKSIPFGQPILIGHHSESRDRSFLKKYCRLYDKSHELSKKADYYEEKANTVSNVISSDDEDAISKLELKLKKLIDSQNRMKEINKHYRKEGKAYLDKLMSDEKEAVIINLRNAATFSVTKNLVPFPSYVLSNNNQAIRNTQKRIALLKSRQAEPEHKPIQGNGYVLKEDKSDNRILFIFDDKPCEAIRTLLKRNGFKWSPNRNAWVRMLNQNGRWATNRVIDELNSAIES